MKILFPEWKSFGNQDMIAAFLALGHEVKRFPFQSDDYRHDKAIQDQLISVIRAYSPDFVFTFNYFPVISLACKACDVKYVSWIYDSPYVMLYSYTVIYPGNYIFVFDKEQYLEFHKSGITTVYYLPLAANPERLQSMLTEHATLQFHQSSLGNRAEIAFVGSLYTEKHQFYQRLNGISSYTKGYLEGLMTAQSQVYGYNFIQELLTPDIIADLQKALPMQPDFSGTESVEYLYAQYVINRELTAIERKRLLTAVSSQFGLDLYTPNASTMLPGAINHGPVDYYDMAPFVFHEAKINLNITLRSIHSGIPLRALDIMGAGGFLLSNYQADFSDCFLADEDFVFFENEKDLLAKTAYYLSHEEERSAIAANGQKRIREHHTYVHRVEEILSIIE